MVVNIILSDPTQDGQALSSVPEESATMSFLRTTGPRVLAGPQELRSTTRMTLISRLLKDAYMYVAKLLEFEAKKQAESQPPSK